MSHELRALYDLGQSITPKRSVSATELTLIIREGFVAVVKRQPRYCPYTDAMLPGTDDRIVAVVLNAECGAILAQAFAEANYEYCGDGSFEVWLHVPNDSVFRGGSFPTWPTAAEEDALPF